MRFSIAALSLACVLAAGPTLVTPAKAQEPTMADRHGPGTQWYQPYGKGKRVKIEQTHQRAARHVRRSVARITETIRHAAGGMVTVPTAAGISITVAPSAAPKFQGLIRDLVSAGYTPSRINCFARGGHVRRSYHYSGEACDIDNGTNRRNPSRFRFAAIISRHGLRDGCSFNFAGRPDCGHVDTGSRRVAALDRQPHPFLGARYAGVQ